MLQPNAVAVLKRCLLPLADVITPKLPEAEALTGIRIQSDADVERAACLLQEAEVKNVVIKGGHSAGLQSVLCRDWVFTRDGGFVMESPRFPTRTRTVPAARLPPASRRNWQKVRIPQAPCGWQKILLPKPSAIR